MVELEKALKHLSDNYMDIGRHNDEKCVLCIEIYDLYNKYDFVIEKTWDYDD